MSRTCEKAMQKSIDVQSPDASKMSSCFSSSEPPLKCEPVNESSTYLTASTRKLPFHLPPLDPNLNLARSFREKKKEVHKNKLTASSSDPFPKKNGNKQSINLHTDGNGGGYELSLKKKQNMKTDGVSLPASELPPINWNGQHENGEFLSKGTQKLSVVTDSGEPSTKTLKRTTYLTGSTGKHPCRLPPLDPSVFEKRKIPKPARSFRENKKEVQKNELTASSSDPFPKKNGNRQSINLHTDGSGGGYELPLKKKQNIKTDGVSLSESELPPINWNGQLENDEFLSKGTQKLPVVTDSGKPSTRTLNRRSGRLNQITCTMEVLPSKKAIVTSESLQESDGPKLRYTPRRNSHFTPQTKFVTAGSSSAFCTVTSCDGSHDGSRMEIQRMRRRSRSLGDTTITPDEIILSWQNSSTQADGNSGCTFTQRVTNRVQSTAIFESTIPTSHTTKEDNSLDDVSAFPALSNPQNQTRFSNVVRKGGCSKRFNEKARVLFRAQTAAASRRDPTVDHIGRENENGPGSFLRSPNSTGNSNTAGNGGHDSKEVRVVRRSWSQQDVSQFSQFPASWRERRAGVCNATESNDSMTERQKARVFMKKFGGLINNPSKNDSN